MTQPTPYQLPPVPAPAKKKSRKWVVLSVLAAAAIIGTVTTSNDDAAPEPTAVVSVEQPTRERAPAPPPAPAPSNNQVEDIYILTLETSGLGIENTYSSDAEAINLGHQVCGYLERGAGNTMGAAQVLVSNGFSPAQAGYTVGAAVAAFCPEQG